MLACSCSLDSFLHGGCGLLPRHAASHQCFTPAARTWSLFHKQCALRYGALPSLQDQAVMICCTWSSIEVVLPWISGAHLLLPVATTLESLECLADLLCKAVFRLSQGWQREGTGWC